MAGLERLISGSPRYASTSGLLFIFELFSPLMRRDDELLLIGLGFTTLISYYVSAFTL